MTRTRRLAALAAVLVLATGGAATAARAKPRPLCNLVTDPAGDTKTGNESLDVVSGDIATDGKTLTVAIRVKKLTAEDLTSPTGRFYELSFQYDGAGQQINAVIDHLGQKWANGKGTGKFDVARNEVRIHIPVDSLIGRPALRPGALLTNLLVRTDIGNPVVPIPTTAMALGDSAKGTKSYPINALSCVRPGV